MRAVSVIQVVHDIGCLLQSSCILKHKKTQHFVHPPQQSLLHTTLQSERRKMKLSLKLNIHAGEHARQEEQAYIVSKSKQASKQALIA